MDNHGNAIHGLRRQLADERNQRIESGQALSRQLNEANGEVNRFRASWEKLKEQNNDLRFKLNDWQDASAKVMSEQCPPDERHCTCVPFLRREIAELRRRLNDTKAREMNLFNHLVERTDQVTQLEQQLALSDSMHKAEVCRRVSAESTLSLYAEKVANLEEQKEIVAPVECSPDGQSTEQVIDYIIACASAWSPNARILGNARACDIKRAILDLKQQLAAAQSKLTVMVDRNDVLMNENSDLLVQLDAEKQRADAAERRCGELEEALKSLIDLAPMYAPHIPNGHVCGPEGNCDCICEEVAVFSTVLSNARNALAEKGGKETK